MSLMLEDAIRMYGGRNLYLRGLTDEALSERLVHWFNNCLQLSPTGMIDLCATENPDYFHRFTDAIAESALRYGDVSKAQFREMWDPKRNAMIAPSDETSRGIEKMQMQIARYPGLPLIRFGQRNFMQELFEVGGALFQEASTFKSSENLSVKDDELTLLMKRYVPRDELHLVPGAPNAKSVNDRGAGMNFSLSCPDFLVLCLTDKMNFRLISDWNAKSAVIIHDPQEFSRRLSAATLGLVLEAGAESLESGKVRYIDPYFPLENPDVPFCKHFKFAYQREFRFVIRGGRRVDIIKRKIEIGSIKDIASLVDLD